MLGLKLKRLMDVLGRVMAGDIEDYSKRMDPSCGSHVRIRLRTAAKTTRGAFDDGGMPLISRIALMVDFGKSESMPVRQESVSQRCSCDQFISDLPNHWQTSAGTAATVTRGVSLSRYLCL